MVTIVAAAMPGGANVFLFSQRCRVAPGPGTATVAPLLTVSAVRAGVGNP